MFVANYTLNIQPLQTQQLKTTQRTTQQRESFFDTLQQQTLQTKQNSPLEVDYIHSKNYYTNRYKFQHQTSDDEKRFQTLAKQQQLPQSYATSFTTFYDLTKPKKALSPIKHSTLALLLAKQNAPKTYNANNLYYQRTSVS